jgi:threonine dehydrogenase-like Zn-dependent dehydrogenase
LPALARGQVLVKTLYTMVSTGTEMRVFSGRGEATDRFPLVPGYCVVGEVVEVGSDVTGFRAGDLVSGRNSDTPVPGCSLVYGGQRSCHIYPATGGGQPVLLPAGAKPLDYIVTEPAAISGRGARLAAPQPGESAIVVGQGLIGSLSAAWLVAAGCRVIAIDLHPARLERARRLGVTSAINASDEKSVKARVEALLPGGADIVVDASASGAGFRMACSLVRPLPDVPVMPSLSRLVIQASYQGPEALHPTDFFPGEGVVILTPGDRRTWDRAAAVAALQDGRLPAAEFLDQVVPYRAAQAAYLRLRDDPANTFSLVFDWGSTGL